MGQLPQFFLKSGALLGLDGDRIALGSGGFEHSEIPPEGRLSFYAPDFFLKDRRPWKTPRQCWIWPRQGLLSLIRDFGFRKAPPPGPWLAPARQDFETSFEGLKQAFATGSLKKGVPVVFESALAQLTPELLAGMLLELLSKESGGRVYGYWDLEAPEGILGLSPEDLFVARPGGELRTMALAGTYPKDAGAAAFLDDPKERKEHQCVVDDIRESLARFGDVSVGETGVIELPSFMHLRTRIAVSPRERVSFLEWANALHPTAALGAFPRKKGAVWLKNEDIGVGRGRFGAPFGACLEDGSAVCVVAIRNVQWDSFGIRLGSGCGVVQESILDREWRELALKRDSVKRNFGWV